MRNEMAVHTDVDTRPRALCQLSSWFILACAAAILIGCDRKPQPKTVGERVNDRLEEVAATYSADYSWVRNLEERLQYTRHLLTSDLEAVWLTGQPVVYKGRLLDLVRTDAAEYVMLLDSYDFQYSIPNEELRVQLRCPFEVVDEARRSNQDFNDAFGNGALVVANIERVVSTSIVREEFTDKFPASLDEDVTSDYETQPVLRDLRIGIGRCLAIVSP